MKISVCAFFMLYVGLTSERNIPDLTQIKSKSLDILADNEINSDNHAHNVNRKIERVSSNITNHNSVNSSSANQNNAKLQNDNILHTLQNDFKNVSLYEHVQDKQNDINERSFVFIDTKYKVPFHHQNNMLRRNYAQSVNRDNTYVRPWDSSLNYKDSSQNFLEGSYKEEPPLKLYVDPYTNPSTAYVQSNDDYYKLHLDNTLSQELRSLEKKVKAANALIDYQYSDIRSQGNRLETNTKDPLKLAQENREYSDLIKLPAVRPDTIMMKNQNNQHVKTTDVLDRYKIYGYPNQMPSNEYRDNVFDHSKHKSEFHDKLSMNTFQQLENNKNYFSNSIRTSDNHVNGNSDIYRNHADLAVQPNLQSDEDDFVNKFDHDDSYDNRIINPQTNNYWIDKNHMRYAHRYDRPVDAKSESKYLKNIDASTGDAQNTAAKSQISEPSLKYNHLPQKLQNEMIKPHHKTNTYIPNEFASEFSKNKPATSEQNKNNYEKDRDSNDQSRKSFYLTNKLPPNYDGDMKYSSQTEQADLKNSYSSDKQNRISNVETIFESLKKNNYLREKYRPNIEPNLNSFTEEGFKTKAFQNIDERPAEVSIPKKPTATDNVITQDDSPTIEIQHPDSKTNYLTIKFHPSESKDSPVIKIRPPKFSGGRTAPKKYSSFSGSFNKVTNDYEINKKHPDNNVQPAKFAGKSIEIYPKLNEIYSPPKTNDLTESNENKPKYQQSILKDNVYFRPMQHRVINKPPPPDLIDNEVTMTLQQKDHVFKQLNEKLNEINNGVSNELHGTSERTEKTHDDCMMDTLIRRITNKSVVVTPKPFRESCVYPECMEKAILNSDPNNPTCECEYAIKQNMSKNSDYGDLELPVPASHESSIG